MINSGNTSGILKSFFRLTLLRVRASETDRNNKLRRNSYQDAREMHQSEREAELALCFKHQSASGGKNKAQKLITTCTKHLTHTLTVQHRLNSLRRHDPVILIDMHKAITRNHFDVPIVTKIYSYLIFFFVAVKNPTSTKWCNARYEQDYQRQCYEYK